VTIVENFSKFRAADKNQVIGMERVHLKRQLKAVLLADLSAILD
jgi:hypothetical protein